MFTHLKVYGALLATSQISCFNNQQLFGNEQRRAVDSIKHCGKWLIGFEKEVFFHEFDFETSELDQASESPQLSVTRVFFLSLLSRNFDHQLSSNFHRFVFYAYVELHHMRRLVFDNYL